MVDAAVSVVEGCELGGFLIELVSRTFLIHAFTGCESVLPELLQRELLWHSTGVKRPPDNIIDYTAPGSEES